MRTWWVWVLVAACGGEGGAAGDGGLDAPSDAGADAPACATASLTPAVVDFGTVAVATTSALETVTLTNTCATPTDVGSFLLVGADASSFAIESVTCLGQLAPGASCIAGVTATPQASGAKTATLQHGPTVLSVTLEVNGEGLVFDPVDHDFGTAPIGGGSPAFVFSLTNHAAVAQPVGTAGLGGADAGQFAVTDFACPASLAAGASCAVTAQLRPMQSGAPTATLEVGGATATMHGSVAGSWLAIAPLLQDFGSVGVGHASNAVAFTVTNTRGIALPMPTFALTGSDAGSFALGATTCVGELAIGATCTIAVTAPPAGVGSRMATLTATASEMAVATLRTTGISVDDILTLTPSVLSFDPTQLTQTATASNIGGTDLTPTSIAFTGAGAAAFSVASTTCLATVHPGASCSLTIAYAPGAGDAQAGVRFVGATSGTIGLFASATAPGDLAASALFVDFGNVIAGNQSTRMLAFTNHGASSTAPLSFAFSNLGAWRLTSDLCSGASLPAGARCNVEVGFRPDGGGMSTSTITATAGALTAHANLSGTGVASGVGLQLTPASHDFGAVPVGVHSSALTFVATNDGGASILTPEVSLSGASASQFELVQNTCTTGLAPNEFCSIDVRFAPTVDGADTAMLVVDGRVSQLIGHTVSGGVYFPLPTTTDFGSVAVGATAQQTLQIHNVAADDSGTPQLTLTGPNAGDFAIASTTCVGPVAAGASCAVTLSCTPSATGLRDGDLILSASPGGTATTQLTCTGTTP